MDNIYKSLNNNNVLVALVIIITLIIFFRILNKKEHFTNESIDDGSLMTLQDFTKFAVSGPKGEPGDKGSPGAPGEKGPRGEKGSRGTDFSGAITSTGKLWLGSWGEGNSGNNLDREVQLYLGGKFGHGANGGRAGETTYKLKIDSYDNTNSLVYPIYCKDRSGNVDFYLQNRSNSNPNPKLYVGGDFSIAGSLIFESDKMVGFKVRNELVVQKVPNQEKSGNLRVEGDLSLQGNLNLEGDVTLKNIRLGKWTIKEDSRGDLVFEHQGQIKMYLSQQQVNFNRARFGEFSLVPEGNKLSVMHGKKLCGNFQAGEFRAAKVGSTKLCTYKNITDSTDMVCMNGVGIRNMSIDYSPKIDLPVPTPSAEGSYLIKAFVSRVIRITRDYRISLDIKPLGKVIGWTNIMHITSIPGPERGEYWLGHRYEPWLINCGPSIAFWPNTYQLHLRIGHSNDWDNYACGENGGYGRERTKYPPLTPNIWNRLIIEVINKTVKIHINGKIECTYTMKGQTLDKNNMFVYLSNPWHTPANARVKNVTYERL